MKKAEREEMLRRKLEQMKEYEEALYEQGASYIGGVDEVGRGPLAGPVVAACVILPRDFDVIGVDDSKKLTPKKREQLAPVIKEKAVAYGLGMADEKVIDSINILEATKGAMKTAVGKARKMLIERTGADIDHVLFDAVTVEGLGIDQTAIIKGDGKSVTIAAASIFAKVTRDKMMEEYAKQYPGYAFESNKGYGTKAHFEGIERLGLCPIHRRTFLRKYL